MLYVYPQKNQELEMANNGQYPLLATDPNGLLRKDEIS